MSEWKEYTLDQIADVQTGPFGSQLHASDYVQAGIPSIMPKDIGQRLDVIVDSIAYIAEADAQRLQKYRVKPNDIVFSRRGDVEKCAFMTNRMDGWLCGTGCLKVSFTSDEIVPRFIAYYFSTSEAKQWLTNHAVGTTMPNLNSGTLGRFPLLLPPLAEQQAIAGVLSSLDDKIDLLHRQNKTLEALAQTLFRHWFVDGAESDWEEVRLGDFVQTTSGGTPSRTKMEYYDGGTILWVKSKELTGSYIIDTEEKITEEGLRCSSAKLLPKNAILIAMYGATVGQYALLSSPATCNQAVCALLPNDSYPYTFLFMFIKLQKENLVNLAVGSAQQNISQILIKSLNIPAPSNKILEYHKKVNPLFEKMRSNLMQIRTLENLRNTLLPKLMSGEVRVRL